MKKRTVSLVVGTALVSTLASTIPAQAAKSYSNCTALHRAHRYGVAKSAKAANKQARTDHYRPKVHRGLYLANDNLDADKDGTACEVSS